MRIIIYAIISLIFIALTAAIIALIGREVLIEWGMAKVRTSLSILQSTAQNPGPYFVQCRQKGASTTGPIIDHLQLRFTDSSNYVLEAICDGFPQDPIEISGDKLPAFVTKLAGSGGIIWGQQSSGIMLSIWGENAVVKVENKNITSGWSAPQSFASNPASTCTGYGYTCCQDQSQQGSGMLYDQATDCPRTCFPSCINRPVVLSFASDPFADGAARVAQIKSGEQVTFSYVISSEITKNLLITLNYGDGASDQFHDITGTMAHTYACKSITNSPCIFTANIHIVDQNAVTSVDTPITKITVSVAP